MSEPLQIQSPGSEQKVAAMFDRIAGRYDLLNRLLSARQDQRWRQALVQRVPHRPEGVFLDVATGTGDVIAAAKAEHPEYGQWLGVDISEAMLDRARDKCQPRPEDAARVGFRTMSATNLTLEDESADCLTIAFGLRNVVDRPKALQEFSRVLKPGGTLLILEFFLPETGLLGAGFQFYFHKILPAIGGLLSDRTAYSYLPQSVGSFYTPEELRHKLGDTGFSVEEIVPFLFGATRIVHAVKKTNDL